MRLIIFSDLDGTLLDHEDYSFAGADQALARLRRLRIPLVLVTSKTRPEVELVRARLQNEDPFVVENGGGIFFPRSGDQPRPAGSLRRDGYWLVRPGVDYSEVRAFAERTGRLFGLRGFGDMTDAEVAELTGLPSEEAGLARTREFTEPFLLEDPEGLEPLVAEAARRGLAVTRGGRFFHLVGAGQDKGRAVQVVVEVLGAVAGPLRSIGAGDSPNDIPMLEAVDFAVVVPRPDGAHLKLNRESVVVAPKAGSAGWNSAVLSLLDRFAAAEATRPDRDRA